MKSLIFTLILIISSSFSFADEQIIADETTYPAEVTVEKAFYPQEINVPHALWRGVINAFTGWLEIPREIIMENNKYPFFGIISGTLRGSFFTSTRAVLSVVDIGLFGFTGPSGYDPNLFPEYVWNSEWNPYSETIKKSIEPKDDFILHSASIGAAK